MSSNLLTWQGVLNTALCDKGLCFSGNSGFLTNKTYYRDITEILLKVLLNTIKLFHYNKLSFTSEIFFIFTFVSNIDMFWSFKFTVIRRYTQSKFYFSSNSIFFLNCCKMLIFFSYFCESIKKMSHFFYGNVIQMLKFYIFIEGRQNFYFSSNFDMSLFF